MMSFWTAALSLSVALALGRDDGQETRSAADSRNYTYHVRPVVQFGSNPYRDGRLKLECVVSGPRDARFSLGWRHRSSMAAEVTKLKGTSRGTRRDSVQSSHLIFDPLLPNPSRVGHYWCVVFADGNEVASSESVVLLPPEAYADDVHPISATLHPYQRQATPPTNSTQASSESGNDSLQGPLYAILAVVVVFCGVIVVLTISVVLLCHRKCKVFAINTDLRTRSEHRTDGRDLGPPPQATQPPPTCEHPPEHAVGAEVQTPPPQKPTIPAASPQPGDSHYSKLAEWTRDAVIMATSPSVPGSLPALCPGPHTIYSMDNSSDGYGGVASYDYHTQADSLTSSVSGKSVSRPSSHTRTEPKFQSDMPASQLGVQTEQMTLYGSMDRSHDEGTEPVDSRYLGDYERHPDYIPKPLPIVHKVPQDTLPVPQDTPPVPPQRRQSLNHSHKVRSNSETSVVMDTRPQNGYQLDPRYQGDYERDPNYVLPLHNTKQPSPLDDDDKYQGDYERDPNYVPPPCSIEIKPTKSLDHDQMYEEEIDSEGMWDSKYEGDYERDPEYMRNKLMLWPQKHQHHPLSESDLVPIHNHRHGYRALDSTLREPLRPYTQLSVDQITSSSPSNSEFT